jgi:hypothetical protein
VSPFGPDTPTSPTRSLIDVQSSGQQSTLDKDIISAIPTSRLCHAIAALTPGVMRPFPRHSIGPPSRRYQNMWSNCRSLYVITA